MKVCPSAVRLDDKTLIGPLIDRNPLMPWQKALKNANDARAEMLLQADAFDIDGNDGGYYATPALVEMPEQTEIVRHETFAPDFICDGL